MDATSCIWDSSCPWQMSQQFLHELLLLLLGKAQPATPNLESSPPNTPRPQKGILPMREHSGPPPGGIPPMFGPQELSVIWVCTRTIPGKKNGPVLEPSSEISPAGLISTPGCAGICLRQDSLASALGRQICFPGTHGLGTLKSPLRDMLSSGCCAGFSRPSAELQTVQRPLEP